MNKKSIIKIIKYVVILAIVIFSVNIYLASKRIEHYSVLTPLEELSFTERIAANINNSSFKSRDELTKDGLLQSSQTIKNDNNENINKKDDNIECNYSKTELKTMSLSSNKYIDKELKFTGVVVTDDNSSNDKDIDVFTIKIVGTDIFVTMICDKNKVDYSNWRKGTNLNVTGFIGDIKDDNGINITLKKNPTIKIKSK